MWKRSYFVVVCALLMPWAETWQFSAFAQAALPEQSAIVPLTIESSRPSLVVAAEQAFSGLTLRTSVKSPVDPTFDPAVDPTAGGERSEALNLVRELGQLQAHLRNGRIADAGRLAGQLEKREKRVPQDLLAVWALLVAESFEKQKRPLDAFQVLERTFSSRDSGEAIEKRVVQSFKHAVGAGLMGQAFARFRQYSHIFEKDFLPADLEHSMLSLGEHLSALNEAATAKDLLRRIARNYPFSETSRLAYQMFNAKYCRTSGFEEFWGNLETRREAAQNVIKRVGPLPGVRDFALALANINESAPVPNANAANLSAVEKAILLDSAEFLLGSREPQLASRILEYLNGSKTFEGRFEQDRFLYNYARSLNSMQEPDKAAKVYKDLYKRFPRSRFAAISRQRYLLSLHYAKRFKDVARETREQGNHVRKESRWRIFWAEYLARDKAAAATEGLFKLKGKANLDPLAQARTKYWLARLDENGPNASTAKAQMVELDKQNGNTHYAILSRWRLGLNNSEEPSKKVRLAAKSPLFALAAQGKLISLNAPKEFALITGLVQNGLVDSAREKILVAVKNERQPEKLLALSRLAFNALDYKNASLIPRRSFPELWGRPSDHVLFRKAILEKPEIWQLNYPLAYAPVVEVVSRIINIDPFLVYAIMRAESNYDPTAVSGVGARGLMQIMPLTGLKIANLIGDHDFEPANLSRPEINIAFGSWYLKRLMTYYQGNMVLAIAAYNAGPEAIDRWIAQTPQFELDEFIENIPYDQTRNYVAKVLSNMDIYNRIYNPLGNGLELDVSAKLPKPKLGMEMF